MSLVELPFGSIPVFPIEESEAEIVMGTSEVRVQPDCLTVDVWILLQRSARYRG